MVRDLIVFLIVVIICDAMRLLTLRTITVLCCLCAYPSLAQNVWTQHNDQGRTGWYPFETTLNTANVNQNTFGLAFDYTTDERIFSQPLVILNVNIPNKGNKNVVYVATQNNTVYAFDADVNTPAYWSRNYSGVLPGGGSCGNCRPAMANEMHPSLCGGSYPDFYGNAKIGIVGTPVIDVAAGTIYFVTKVVDPTTPGYDNHGFVSGIKDEYNYKTNGFHQYLHAVDIANGNERPNSPVEIVASSTGVGDGQSTPGVIPFDPRRQMARAGLVLNNGKIYIAFAAHCDFNPSHGWVLKYDAVSLALDKAYNSTPNDGRGGIWMSGTAPAVDGAGNLYFTTGNSLNEDRTAVEYNTFNSDPNDPVNRGESVVKLDANLGIADYFTPFNYIELNDADKDFPIQVMLLPGTNLALTGCKDDSLYIFDRNNLTGFDPAKNNVKQRVFVQNSATMHSSFAYFGGPTPYAYQYSENSQLKAYPVTVNGLSAAITNNSIASPSGGSGGYLSVSSNGSDPSTGILWAYQGVHGCNANQSLCPGTLHAVSASNITQELWNSDMVSADNIDFFNKFSCPTIALGKVYVTANSNQLKVYGLKANTTCVNNVALGKTAHALTNPGIESNVIDDNLATKWTGAGPPTDSIYIDLGGLYNICNIVLIWNPTGFASDYDLKVSVDGINWTTVSQVRGNTQTTTEYTSAVTARYVNMRGITEGPGNYSIEEFQIFGSPAANTCVQPTSLTASTEATLFPSTTPAGNLNHENPAGIEVGVRFKSSVNGFVKGIRFYKGGAADGGTHTGKLYSNGGALISSAVFTGETASGWQEVDFGAPVAITAGTTYVATYFSSQGYYYGSANYFTSALVNGPLTAPEDGDGGFPNGVYLYTPPAPGFPTNTYHSGNYWVEPVFIYSNSSEISEHLSWDPGVNVNQYIIKYRPNLSASWITRTSPTNSIDIHPLACGTLYNFTVQADCGAMQSPVASGSFTTADCPPTTCDILPTRYYNVDLGDIGVSGSTCFTNATGSFKLEGSGTDIGGNDDQFQFAFTTNDIADYNMSGRIAEYNPANNLSKTGIMVRDSLTNTSRFAYLAYRNNGFVFEYRNAPGGAVATIVIPGTYTIPYWARISKTGTSYTAFLSPNGSDWTEVAGPLQLNFGNDPGNVPNYGMAVTSADNAVLSSGTIDNFSLVVSQPLPILLLSFTAKNINNDHVQVSWSTSMEHLVDYFEIQKSTDNRGFETFAKVQAVGESQVIQNYSVNDNHPVPGTNYYRLKEVDKDGKFFYSSVVSVRIEDNADMEIYPNPAADFTNVHSYKSPITEVRVYDVTGKLLQSLTAADGQQTIRLNTTGLAQGVYVIQVKTEHGDLYRKKLFRN